MWTIVKEAMLPQLHPEKIIHLAGGYSRVLLSPREAEAVSACIMVPRRYTESLRS